MKEDLPIKNGIVIPGHELSITTSRAGGPGGQHVNKTNTRISVRFNIVQSTAFTDEQKKQILQKLAGKLTTEGEIIIHNSSSRSQAHNKKAALEQLAYELKKALQVTKKRMKTHISKQAQEQRIQDKKKHSQLKKSRKTLD